MSKEDEKRKIITILAVNYFDDSDTVRYKGRDLTMLQLKELDIKELLNLAKELNER